MSESCKDEDENVNMAEFFGQEMEDWRSKMIKVFSDQHPYNFFVTAGHDFEDLILKIMDFDEPFDNLMKMTEIDRKAEKEFHQILTKMEKERSIPEVKDVLEQKKKECATVFDMFDKIVSVCENYFKLEYSDCRKRICKHTEFQEPIINEVEKFLIEVEEFGDSELKSLQERISKWIYIKGLSMLNNIGKSYNLLNDQPFPMSIWFDSSAALTSKELRHAFLADQKEMSNLWKKAFSDLLMLSAKLEICRCNYNLMKFKLEREIFWMNRAYKENMPELTKIQRRLASLNDERLALKLEMKNLEIEVNKEHKKVIHAQNKMCRQIKTAKANNKFALQTAYKKFHNVLNTKKEEIYNFLTEVLKGDQFIHEEILGVTWNPVDLSPLKLDDDNDSELERDLEKSKASFDMQGKTANPVDEDNFHPTFKTIISNENFINLLNILSDELEYMLDFTWVNYVKEKLELAQEVKWLELFKVFKIDFEDLKELKEHMISYCKFSNDGEIVFDINGATDGFLHFVCKKRQSSSPHILPSLECDPEKYKNYWSSTKTLIPKSLLWKNVEEVLFKYLELLETRSNLLKSKFSVLAENEKFENYLENYHKYCTYNVY